MREPTRSEKILLSVFGLMILGFVLILGWQTLQRSLFSHRQTETTLREQLVELQRWETEAPVWQSRAEWLRENPAPVWESDQSEATFVQELQQSFAANSLTILSQRLAGTTNLGDFQEISVQMTIRGSTENIVRWLHQTQQPGEFHTIRQLTIRADADKENLRAEITAVRHLLSPGPVPATNDPGDASPPPDEAPPFDPPAEQNPDEEQLPGEGGEPPMPPDVPPAIPSDSSWPAPPNTQSPSELDGHGQIPPATPADRDEYDNPPDLLEALPLPVLPFDDVFDPNSPSDDPVSVPAEEVFELLPVPQTP